MNYMSPIIEISVLCECDIVMISGVEVKKEIGTLNEIQWSDVT